MSINNAREDNEKIVRKIVDKVEMATTSVVLDTASSPSMASPQALSPVAEAVLSKMAVVSDEV